jgi:hydroxymethylglutaryl-CoA lyase
MANRTVKLIECPRDAWQGLSKQIPTEVKVHYLRALIDAEFKHIDAVSFVSPKAVPQMADSEELLKQLEPPSDVEIIGIVVNERGAERAIATGRVTTLGYPCSISETFLRRNQNQSATENLEVLRSIKRRADERKLGMVAYISMAFGNPYGDAWGEAEIKQTIAQITALGLRQISLADTVGVATPELIGRVVRPSIQDFGAIEIGVHLHGTHSDAVAKVLAAYEAGCRRFDSAIGGLGGCPFAQDALVGNVPTESVINALSQRNVDLRPPGSLETLSAITAHIGSRFGAAA